MAYTRRQELFCTEDQMNEKPDVILRHGEVIRIKMNNGNINEKMGDGVTPIIDLPYTNGGGNSVVQHTGNSAEKVMSQKSVADLSRMSLDALCENNLFAYATINGAISQSGGDRSSSSIDTSCRRTPYIPVTAGCKLTYSGFAIHDGYPCIAVYDANMALVSSVNGIGTSDSTGRKGTLTFAHSGFIRLCSMRASAATAIITQTSVVDARKTVNDMARTHSYSAFANMVAVAETYFKEAYQHHNLVYGSQRSAMHANQKDENGMNAINCSGFINTILRGITYENSRYVNDHNKFADWGWVSDRSGHYEYDYETRGEIYEYMSSYHLAKYCAEHGWLRKVNYTGYADDGSFTIASADRTKPDYMTNIHVGDIVFTGRGITEENGGTYLGINDVALVVAIGHYMNSDGTTSHTIAVMSAYDHTDVDGNRVGVDINRYTHDTAEFTYAATVPVQEALFANNVVMATKNLNELNSGNEIIYNYSSNSYMEAGLYTFSVHGDSNTNSLSTYAPYLSMSYDGSNSVVVTSCKNGGWSDIVVYAEKPFTWMLKCKKGIAEKYGVFDELIVYRGAKPCLLTH